ncbi:hypothetical protein [Cohnella faecalis]|nr:hypothetical protein [Cohnella faecalis]
MTDSVSLAPAGPPPKREWEIEDTQPVGKTDQDVHRYARRDHRQG